MNANVIKPDVLYAPNFLSRFEADELLTNIMAKSDFHKNYIQLYGTNAVPRFEAWYSPWDYQYSKNLILKANPMPDYLQKVIERLKARAYGEYNVVLINCYRDGKDYISWHSDDDFGDFEPTVALITLGAVRPSRLRLRTDKTNLIEYKQEHGSLLIMRGKTNADWEHMVPEASEQIGGRMNLTFRFNAGS